MMNIKEVLLLQFKNVLIKNPLYLQKNLIQVVVLNLGQINSFQMKFINQLLKTFKKEKYVIHVKTIFWGADLADMQLIWKFNKGFRF